MSVKAKRLFIIYTAAMRIALSTMSAVCHARLEEYRMTASYSSQRAFEAAVSESRIDPEQGAGDGKQCRIDL